MRSRPVGLKQSFGVRLAILVAVGAGFLGIPAVAEATLVVTIAPDETGMNGTVNIDFDGNGNPEFLINHRRSDIPPGPPPFVPGFEDELWMDVGPGASSQGYVVIANSEPAALQLPFTVSGAATFSTGFASKDAMLAWYTTTLGFLLGNFPVPTRAFIGVRFNLGAGTRYGWIELETYDNHLGRVLQFGYDDLGNPVDLPVPEPGSLLLLAGGLAALIALRRGAGTPACRVDTRVDSCGTAHTKDTSRHERPS